MTYVDAPGNFTPGKEMGYVLAKRLGGPHSWFGRFGKQKNILPLPGFRIPDHPARRLVTIFPGCGQDTLRPRVFICNRARQHWSCSQVARTGGH